jgi:hypothetical protein
MTVESKQAQALLRVFEALGVPLIGAVDELMAWQGGGADPNPTEAANRFAALLSASINAGTQMSTKLAPRNQEEAEVVRLRTSTLAGAVIAQHYVLSGSMPDETFTRRLNSAFDGLLSLADSFPLLPDEQAGSTDLVAQRVEALTPFVAAVMRFPFGQEDSLVIRKLGEPLCDRASALADAFSGGNSDGPDLYAERELAFLKGGAKLLARACEVEMDRLQHAMSTNPGTQPPAPDVLSERIWQRFEDGLDVLRAVIGFMSDPNAGTVHAAPMPAKPVRAPAPAKAPAAAGSPPKAATQPQGGPFNPMAFFVKKDDNGDADTSGEAA